MKEIAVKIINKSGNPLPKYATVGSAGMDIPAWLADGKPVVIPAHTRVLIPTGLYLEIPEGYECQVRPRSGLALKKGITVLNTPGTIDCDYRGEVGVILYNSSDEDFTVNSGDKIAQMVFKEYVRATFVPADELSATVRADGAYGHSDKVKN